MVFSNLCECSSPRQLPRQKQSTRRDTKQLLRSCSREQERSSEKRARNALCKAFHLFSPWILSLGVTSSRDASAILASQSCC